MEQRKIGSLDVSVIGIGGGNWGGRVDEAQSIETIHAALDAGVTFFDTADVYPVVPPGRENRSEETLGKALKGHRHEIVLSSKFGQPYGVYGVEGGKPDPEHAGGGKPDYIRKCIEGSLRRLDTDYIDLYQIHSPDPNTPIAETLGALAELVKEGKVREIGNSNFSVEQLREAAAAVAPGNPKFVSTTTEYSLLARGAELDVIPECEATGLALIPWFPLYNGLLAGGYRAGKPWPEDSRFFDASDERKKQIFSDRNLNIVESLALYAEERGHTLLDLAFARLLANPCLATVIAGAVNGEQVQANVATASWKLTMEEIADIDKVAPVS